jgi:hypothetical protein
MVNNKASFHKGTERVNQGFASIIYAAEESLMINFSESGVIFPWQPLDNGIIPTK